MNPTPPKRIPSNSASPGWAPVYLTVIAFDVANDRRRRRLTRVLQAWGQRVLESVFEAWLTETQCNRLEQQALECINPDADRLALYTLPPADAKDCIILGQGQATHDLRYVIV